MRAKGLKALLASFALGLLAASPPVAALAQDSPTADATSDQTDAAPRIDEPFGHAWLGAADADVTLVVFADYACAACRDAQPVIDQLLAQDSKLKVVYRFLVNEEESRPAAMTSLAVAQVSADWGRFHRALDAAGAPTAKTVADALAASGIDPGKLPDIRDQDPEADELSRNGALIVQRNGTSIPVWLIGDGSAQKGFDLPRLQAAIAQARAAKKP